MKTKSIEEIACFPQSGNYEPITEKTACLNLAYFDIDTDNGNFTDVVSACPYDAFLPVPFDEQITTKFDFESNTALDYCKTKLKCLVTELRSREKRATFNFHVGNCVDLCLKEPMKNKFHVIYTYDLADRVAGLVNLLPAALACPSIENLQSLLLTETAIWTKLEEPTVTEFVETSLGCPISLVPTLYGVRLVNRLKLGSPDCVKLHDFRFTRPITLQWLRAASFSNNVIMYISHFHPP